MVPVCAYPQRPHVRAASLACAVAVAAVIAACSETPSDNQRRAGVGGNRPPNVILLVLGSTRADHLSYNGYRHVTTPSLDRFSKDAVNYRQAHSVAPWTLPSHASLFTGLFPGEHGLTWASFAEPADMGLEEILEKPVGVADRERLLARVLQRSGYATVGFSNNTWVTRRTGLDHGFDRFFEMGEGRSAPRRYYDRLRNWLGLLPALETGDAGRTLARFTEYVSTEGPLREPFFLFLNLNDPHFPYAPPEPWRRAPTLDPDLAERLADSELNELELVAGRRPIDITSLAPFYDAELTYVDAVVGQLFDWLRAQRYYDNAFIGVTSDHGEHLGERNKVSHELSIEEEVLHVPLLIKWPGNRGAGRVVDDPLASPMDLYATILGAARVKNDSGLLVSEDLSSVDAPARDYLVAEYDYALPYLRLLQSLNAEFPVDAHRVIRRVVYTRTGRYEFATRERTRVGDLISSTSGTPEGGATQEHQRVAAVLEAYVDRLSDRATQDRGALPMDKETLERLRSLGYIR